MQAPIVDVSSRSPAGASQPADLANPANPENPAKPANPASAAAAQGATRPLTPTEALLRGFEPQAQAADAAIAGIGLSDLALSATVPSGPVLSSAAPSGNAASGVGPRAAATTTARQGFRVGGLNMMIGYADGSELTELPSLFRLPLAPAWFAGMANLHGRLVPVFDLARRFGLPPLERARPMLLVLAHGADAAGVLIDGLPQRLSFDPARTAADEASVPSAIRPYVTGLHSIDSDLWLDLDVPALLAALEQALAHTPTASH